MTQCGCIYSIVELIRNGIYRNVDLTVTAQRGGGEQSCTKVRATRW